MIINDISSDLFYYLLLKKNFYIRKKINSPSVVDKQLLQYNNDELINLFLYVLIDEFGEDLLISILENKFKKV